MHSTSCKYAHNVCIQSLKNRKSFILGRKGHVFFGKHLIVQKILPEHKLSTEEEYQKKIVYHIGYTASKKVGNAIERNFAKRRMRSLCYELFVKEISEDTQKMYALSQSLKNYTCCAPNGIILIAKSSLVITSYNKLKKELENALRYLFLKEKITHTNYISKKK